MRIYNDSGTVLLEPENADEAEMMRRLMDNMKIGPKLKRYPGGTWLRKDALPLTTQEEVNDVIGCDCGAAATPLPTLTAYEMECLTSARKPQSASGV
jgi:hypothetical protein